MAMMKCPVCGVSVKAENLERHLRNQHPHEQVDLSKALTEEDRQAIKEQKSSGRAGLTRGGRRLLVIVGIVIVVVIVAAIGVQYLARPTVNPGSAAPDFTLTSTDGVTITLSAWRGSPVLIEFMDVDCPYCQQEAPTLSVLYQNYSARGVRFVSIDINFDGAEDTPSRITSFKATYSTPWPYCLDSLAGVASRYGVSSTPTSFVINKNGTVNVKLVGVQPMGNFVSALNSALGG